MMMITRVDEDGFFRKLRPVDEFWVGHPVWEPSHANPMYSENQNLFYEINSNPKVNTFLEIEPYSLKHPVAGELVEDKA